MSINAPHDDAAAAPRCEDASPAGGTALAATHWPAHVRFWLIAAGGLTLDLWSKHWAFHALRQTGDRIVVVPHALEFELMFNTGALFGIGQGQTTLFVIASVLALTLVAAMFLRSGARRALLHVALAGIFAGALGNMYDRVFVKLYPQRIDGELVYLEETHRTAERLFLAEYPPTRGDGRRVSIRWEDIGPTPFEPVGCVRDFIKIPTRIFGEQELWPWVFNVADMLLVGGVGILAAFLWRDGRRPEPALQSAATQSAAGRGPLGDDGARLDSADERA